MSLLLLLAGASSEGVVVTGVDTGLELSLPTLMVRGPMYVIPFLATEDNQAIEAENGEHINNGTIYTLIGLTLPTLKARKVR